MESKLELQQLSISLIAKNYNPARITPDFLAASGIIPHEWQLAAKPSVTQNAVQLKFKNGLGVTAQPGSITFSEAISTTTVGEIEAALVATRYLESLPAADYQQLRISPMCLYNLGNEVDTVRKLIVEGLLTPSPWHSFGSTPTKAAIELIYELERCQLNLKVDEVRFQQGENSAVPGLMFVGDFIYSFAEQSGSEKINRLKTAIASWQQDVKMFQAQISKNIIKTARAAISSQPESISPKILVKSI